MRNQFSWIFLFLTFTGSLYSQTSTHQQPEAQENAIEPPAATPNMPAGMTLIPEGEFWMGRVHFFLVDAIGWFERDRQDNTPPHRVQLDAFFIDQNEINNQEYMAFVKANNWLRPWQWPDGGISEGKEKVPVYNVSWEDADAYCKWAKKRLPTEAEWEKAARGGLDRMKFPWGNEGLGLAGEYVNDDSMIGKTRSRAHTNYPFGPAPVGSYPSNAYGINDMSGNLWEWVDDWYYRNYYSISPLKDPKGPQKGKYKIIRGGGWSDSDERNLMNHFRSYADPEVRSTTVGFRCAQSLLR